MEEKNNVTSAAKSDTALQQPGLGADSNRANSIKEGGNEEIEASVSIINKQNFTTSFLIFDYFYFSVKIEHSF